MIERRRFLVAGLTGAAACLAFPRLALARLGVLPARAKPPAPSVVAALETSPYVYISPLKSNGKESTCHGEVWFAWLDGDVVAIVASDRWKVRSIERGLDRARIWVGDYGRWKGVISKNESFRNGPSFVARAKRVKDAELVDRMLDVYDDKYPLEIGRWRDKMREGHADGTRTLIRYSPE